MNTIPIRVPVTHLPDPEADMSKRPVLAKLTPKNKVRLLLSEMAFDEACEWFGNTIATLGQELENDPWAGAKDLVTPSQVYLLLDLANTQLAPFYLNPQAVKLTMSRAEGCLLWQVWLAAGLPGNQAPALTEALHALHQLLA